MAYATLILKVTNWQLGYVTLKVKVNNWRLGVQKLNQLRLFQKSNRFFFYFKYLQLIALGACTVLLGLVLLKRKLKLETMCQIKGLLTFRGCLPIDAGQHPVRHYVQVNREHTNVLPSSTSSDTFFSAEN